MKTMNDEKKHYVAPMLVTVSIHTERGYADSTLQLKSSGGSRSTEDYSVGNGWSENSNDFWN
mgnify:CR=1 FL=1